MAAEGTSTTAPQKLKLRAQDADDLAVISAILQDAMVAVAEMIFQAEEKRFVLVANRFCHEPTETCGKAGARIATGLRFDGVTSVQRRGFSPGDSDRILMLLAIRAEGDAVYLDFAGGACIRLESGGVLCHLDDLGEPWPARFRPSHPVG